MSANTRLIYDHEGFVVSSVICDDPTDPHSITGFLDSQDCEPILEANRVSRDAGHGTAENFRLAARVPNVIINKAMREGWYHDPAAWKRWLNDSENRDFRVWTGAA